jgi:hypothetical protein
MSRVLRRSWLNPESHSGTATTPSRKSSFVGRQLKDSKLEAGYVLIFQLHSELRYRNAVRPMSSVNMMSSGFAKPGNAVFYAITRTPLLQLTNNQNNLYIL